MHSLETIRATQLASARDAAQLKKTPYLLRGDELAQWRAGNFSSFPFPNIGDYDPPGWTQVGQLFVDASGWGADDEPALSFSQLLDELEIGYGYAIIEEGQFQLYLGKFRSPHARDS